MELATLSRQYNHFYAPAAIVELAGMDLVRDLMVAVSEVEVDMMLGAASRFSFKIANAYSHEKRNFETGLGTSLLDQLAFGAKVQINMGYTDSHSMPVAVQGIVTEISTDFPEAGSPELTVAGYDHGFPLTIGKNSRTWTKKPDSFAASEIASFHNLRTNIEVTTELKAQTEQNQESDWEFLKKLAERNHFEIYVDENAVFHFAKPNNRASAIASLAYGEGLLSFKPEANLAGQISRVEVYGWDDHRKEAIVGVASAGEESGLNGKSAGQLLNRFVRAAGKQPTLRLRQPVRTRSEAEQLAKAALNERAEKFLTGEGESIGLPEIRPDRNIELLRLGLLFSKTYYIYQATHKLDSGGYRTRFKVKETGL